MLIRGFGDEHVLELTEVATPRPAFGEALVRVGAVEVSRTRDVATRTGEHPFSRQVRLPHVLGGDFAGIVESVGDGVDSSLVGRRVAAACTITCGECPACRSGRTAQCPRLTMIGVHRWGSDGELVCVPVANLHEIPAEVTMAQAAAMAATGPIALAQLTAGSVEDGSVVLVTGATGSLATALIALANRLGARVIGLSRRPSELPLGLSLIGCHDALAPDLSGQLLSSSGGAGIDVAIDNVCHPDTFSRYFPALALGARIIVSGAIGTRELPVLPIPAAALYLRCLSILGVRTATRADAVRFWELVADGFRFGADLVREQPLDLVAGAHAMVAAGSGVGHAVLCVDPQTR